MAAAGDRAGTGAHRALGQLIQAYWFPLYAFIRRQGHDAHQSEDLAQEFFARLLEKNGLTQVDRTKGRFRSFLLASVKHFLANEWDRGHAQKRGGRQTVIALDALDAEARYALEPADEMTPERLFYRSWALTVLDNALGQLRREYEAKGKGELFGAIKEVLSGSADALPYGQTAKSVGMTEGAIKVAVHRLRRRYRQLLQDEIAQTVDSAEQVKEEISYLLNCL